MTAESLDTIAQRVAARSLLALEQLLESKNESIVLRAASAALRSIVALDKPRSPAAKPAARLPRATDPACSEAGSVLPTSNAPTPDDSPEPPKDISTLEVYPGLTVSALFDKLAEAEDRADRADAANNCLLAEINARLPPGVTAAHLISTMPTVLPTNPSRA